MTDSVTSKYHPEDIRNRNSVLSRTFSSLKWILALTVVADHFIRLTDLTINGVLIPMESYPGLQTLFLIIVSFLKNYAVPVFFFMSGFLLTPDKDIKWKNWLPILRRRITRLLIPFIIWGLFGIVITLFFTLLHNGAKGGSIEMPPFYENGILYPGKFFITLFGIKGFPNYNVALWYMRDLIVAIIAVPFIHLLLKIINWRIFIAAAAIIFVAIFNNGRGWRPEVALLFFYAGHLMRYHDIDILKLFGSM